MIRVLLADDQALVRTGFRLIIQNAGDMQVVGEAADGAAAVAMTLETQPDVVLMDIRMPELDGVEATRRIQADANSARVLILTTFDLDEYVYAALHAGASGFLLKDALAPDLLSSVRVVARGDAIVAPSITRRLLERYIGTGTEPSLTATTELNRLTEREREVLGLNARGLSNAEIAHRL
jgi:DNA-binding NarL/FixJ family response regulator